MPVPNISALMQQYPALGILPKSFLLGSDFSDFAAELRGTLEVIRWTFYHFRAYATTGHVQLQFFNQNLGDATNGIADTNMVVGGQLAGGEGMVVRNIRVVPIPAAADAFVANGPAVALQQWYAVLLTNTWLEFTVGDKLYSRGAPLTLYPAGSGLGVQTTASAAAATTTNVAIVQNGDPSNRALYELDPPIYVPATRNLGVTLNWRALQTVTTAGRIGVYLDGWKVRLVQ